MRVNAFTEYALRATIELARAAPRRVSARELNRDPGMSTKFLEQAFTALAVAGIVHTKRGSAGGTTLAKPATEITVGDVIRATDGPILVVTGQSPRLLDYPPEFEGLARYWSTLEQQLESILDDTTIASLAGEPVPARRTLKARSS